MVTFLFSSQFKSTAYSTTPELGVQQFVTYSDTIDSVEVRFNILVIINVTGDNCLVLKRSQIVATVVACAQLSKFHIAVAI